MNDEKIKEELKPCPFCGDKPQFSMCADYGVVFCSCGIQSPKTWNVGTVEQRKEWLTNRWNTRSVERLAKIEVLDKMTNILNHLRTLVPDDVDIEVGYKNAIILFRQKINILKIDIKAGQ